MKGSAESGRKPIFLCELRAQKPASYSSAETPDSSHTQHMQLEEHDLLRLIKKDTGADKFYCNKSLH